MHEMKAAGRAAVGIGHFRHQRMEDAVTGARWVKARRYRSPVT